MKTIVLIAALALALTGCATIQQAEVGDCAKPADTTSDELDMVEADCDSPEVTYRLAVYAGKNKQCPKGDYLIERASSHSKGGGKTKSCYALNVKEGDCLEEIRYFEQRIACGGGSNRRVSKVTEGRADSTLCKHTEEAKTYSEPATTICIGKP